MGRHSCLSLEEIQRLKVHPDKSLPSLEKSNISKTALLVLSSQTETFSLVFKHQPGSKLNPDSC